MKTIYHCTTKENAERILKSGFKNDNGNRIWFTKKDYINQWKYHLTLSEGVIKTPSGFITGDIKPLVELLGCNYTEDDRLKKDFIVDTVVAVTVTDEFYNKEIFDWDKDSYSKGLKGQLSYGEGKNGWNDPINRQPLTSNTDGVIKMEIMVRG